MAGKHYNLNQMSNAATQILDEYEKMNVTIDALDAIAQTIKEQWQSNQSDQFQENCRKMREKLRELQAAVSNVSQQLSNSANVIKNTVNNIYI